jgi:hypothetical protein
MNAQEIFDTVVNHLAQQGTQSMTQRADDHVDRAGDGCAYRGDGGTKCAVGCLIPDDAYNPRMENATVISLAERKELPVDLIEHVALLSQLQEAHDWSSSRSELILKLSDIAGAYNLDGGAAHNITAWEVWQ